MDVTTEPKAMLHRYLRTQREALLAKTAGLSEYDARRPLVGTGTNLLGLLKHVACVQGEYLGTCFGRPFELPGSVSEDDPDSDLYLPATESRDLVLDLFARSCEHADATLDALDLDTVGEVPWWHPDRKHPTLHTVLVHLLVDVARHAGHADILREQLDGSVGYTAAAPNLPDRDADGWAAHVARVEAAARRATGADPD